MEDNIFFGQENATEKTTEQSTDIWEIGNISAQEINEEQSQNGDEQQVVESSENQAQSTVEEQESIVEESQPENVQTETIEQVVEETCEQVEQVATEETPVVIPQISSEDVDKLVGVLDTHFTAIKNLLKYNKDKDANVTKLTKELEMYRDGLEDSILKSMALDLIGLRETWKKSIKQFKERGLTVEDAKKYLNYLIYDCEDLLINLKIEVKNEQVYYNNKAIDKVVEKKAIPYQAEEFTLPDVPQLADKTVEGIIGYLANIESYIANVLKNNAILDNLVKAHIENSALLDEGIYQVVLYPIVRAIVGLHTKAQQEVDETLTNLTGENATRSYVDCATTLVDEMAKIIEQCSVSIEEFVSEAYDSKKHRMQKMIVTENPEENGKVANVYSACYMMDTRVIYPQKVDIYKLKQ